MPIAASFVPWFTELCRRGGLDDPQPAFDAGMLAFDDVLVAINPSLIAPQSDLLFQAPLGSLPSDEAEAAPILHRLLEVQMLMSGPVAPTFGIAFGSNVVCVSVSLRPAEVEVDAAIRVLDGLVQLVRRLRESLQLEPTVHGAPATSDEVEA